MDSLSALEASKSSNVSLRRTNKSISSTGWQRYAKQEKTRMRAHYKPWYDGKTRQGLCDTRLVSEIMVDGGPRCARKPISRASAVAGTN